MTYAEDTKCRPAIFPLRHKSRQRAVGCGVDWWGGHCREGNGGGSTAPRRRICRPEIWPHSIFGTQQQTHTWSVNPNNQLWLILCWKRDLVSMPVYFTGTAKWPEIFRTSLKQFSFPHVHCLERKTLSNQKWIGTISKLAFGCVLLLVVPSPFTKGRGRGGQLRIRFRDFLSQWWPTTQF